MLEELRVAAARQRHRRALKAIRTDSDRLLSEHGELNGLEAARRLVERLLAPDEATLDAYFEHLADALGPDPQTVLRCAQAYAERPDADTLIALTQATEPPRQELFRRLNRAPGGTAAILRLRRALLERLPEHPELRSIEADLHHLLQSWFNPGFLQMQRVNWDSPARLLEKIIAHEAVHSIDGWDDLRRGSCRATRRAGRARSC
jgi:malonyl-CoA decarboxylase